MLRLFRHEDRLVELWGTGILAADDNKKAAPPDRSTRNTKSGAKERRSLPREGSVGSALRSIYQQTVNEEVPREFLDLLGKLT
jgi:hypothetical protein